jgi:hypothetical protein
MPSIFLDMKNKQPSQVDYMSFTREELEIIIGSLDIFTYHDIKECAYQGPIDQKIRDRLITRIRRILDHNK